MVFFSAQRDNRMVFRENMHFASDVFLGGFPSGQRDQTVNLTAQPSQVRILPPPNNHARV